MTNRERVCNAIEGRPCPAPATQIDYTPAAEQIMCAALETDAEGLFRLSGNCLRYASSLGNVEEYFNKDIPFDERHRTALAEGIAKFDEERRLVFDVFGVGWSFDSEGVNSEVHPLSEDTAFSTYHWPLPQSPHLLDPAKESVALHGSDDFILGFQHIGLFERSWALRGYEQFMCDLLLEPDFVEEMLDHILAYKLAEAEMYVQAGVDAVRIGDDFGLQNNLQMPPDIWRQFFKPRYAKLYEFYRGHGMKIFQHSCGAVLSIVPDLVEIGLDVLHPIQPLSIDIDELYRRFGDRLTFWGGIDTQTLMPRGTPADIRRETQRTTAILSGSHRYIAGPSQELMSDVPAQNVLALIEALRGHQAHTR